MLKGNNSTIVGRSASQQLSNRAENEVVDYNMRMQDAGSTALRLGMSHHLSNIKVAQKDI